MTAWGLGNPNFGDSTAWTELVLALASSLPGVRQLVPHLTHPTIPGVSWRDRNSDLALRHIVTELSQPSYAGLVVTASGSNS
jgi:hypothetical protein